MAHLMSGGAQLQLDLLRRAPIILDHQYPRHVTVIATDGGRVNEITI